MPETGRTAEGESEDYHALGCDCPECWTPPENADCEALPLTPKNPRTHVGHHRQSAETSDQI